jgi:hypothetical protein
MRENEGFDSLHNGVPRAFREQKAMAYEAARSSSWWTVRMELRLPCLQMAERPSGGARVPAAVSASALRSHGQQLIQGLSGHM